MDTNNIISKIRNSIDEQLSSVSEYKIPEFSFKDDTKNLRISIVNGYDKNISSRRKEISNSTNIIDIMYSVNKPYSRRSNGIFYPVIVRNIHNSIRENVKSANDQGQFCFAIKFTNPKSYLERKQIFN